MMVNWQSIAKSVCVCFVDVVEIFVLKEATAGLC